MNYRKSLKLATLLKATLSIGMLTGCGSTSTTLPTDQAASHVYLTQITTVGSAAQGYVNGFPVTASGNITEPATQVVLPPQFIPICLTFGPTGKLYVGGGYDEDAPSQVLVYAANANASSTPIATYTGDTPGTFVLPVYLAVNSQEKLFVGSADATVSVFAPDAVNGDLPVQYLTTLPTNGTFSYGLGADSEGNIYLADHVNSRIDVFAAGATGNATPIRTITGTSTSAFTDLRALASDAAGNVFVVNYNAADDVYDGAGPWHGPWHDWRLPHHNSSVANASSVKPMTSNTLPAADSGIYVFAAGASGNAVPTAVITGTNARVNEPEAIAVDGKDNIYYTDAEGGTVTAMVFKAGTSGNSAANTSFTSPTIGEVEGPVELAVY